MSEIIISDTDPAPVTPDGYSTGLEPTPEGFSSPVVFDFAGEVPHIPRDEWDDRIEEMERTKTRLSDTLRKDVPVKSQSSTRFCWINSPTWCTEVVRHTQGQPYVELSPASVGAKIKNFRNVGGWGTEGLEYIADHGLVPASLWPANAINRRYDTDEADAERPKYRVIEWSKLPDRDLETIYDCLFARIPVSIGLNWWSHQVTAVDPVRQGRQYGVRIGNSWGSGWSDNGYGILLGRKAIPDDAVAPRSVVPS